MAPNNLQSDQVAAAAAAADDSSTSPIDNAAPSLIEESAVSTATSAASPGNANANKPKSFWDPNEEKAACGVGFIVNINAQASNRVGGTAFFLTFN